MIDLVTKKLWPKALSPPYSAYFSLPVERLSLFTSGQVSPLHRIFRECSQTALAVADFLQSFSIIFGIDQLDEPLAYVDHHDYF